MIKNLIQIKMRYLLFEYGETPIHSIDLPEVKYDTNRNLNVLKHNNRPAIEVLDALATETLTKVYTESPDSDDNYNMIAATQTHTLVDQEQTDSDDDYHSLLSSVITATATSTIKDEISDSDDD